MKLTCPSCGALTSLEAAANDKAARQVSALFGRLPPEVARALPEYLALFRPQKQGLRWTRVVAVLDELVPMVIDGFVRQGRRRKPTAVVWQEALMAVANRDLVRPLKNHNYLIEVLAGITDKAEGKWEQDRDQAHRSQKKAPARPVADLVSDLTVELDAAKYRAEVTGASAEALEAELKQIREAHHE